MKKLMTAGGLLLGLAFTATIQADEGVRHYKGLESPDLATALVNFADYNQKLQAKLDGELSDADLAEIHALTYTLENALERITDELDDLEDVLEEVHEASERLDGAAVRANAEKYLDVSRTLLD